MHLQHIGSNNFLFTFKTLTPRLTTHEYTLVPLKGLVHICHILANNNWTILTNLCIFTILDLQFPLSITWENAWGISHGPFYLLFHIKIIRKDFSQLGFLEVEFLRDSETVFWKVVALRALQIITLGQ